jgi:transcriptional regulator with PAS, ATPase and Fis domain
VELYAEKYNKNVFSFGTGFLSKLKKHDFPGNVRELQYVLERAVIMTDGDLLKTEDLVFSSIERTTKTQTTQNHSSNLDEIEKQTIQTVIEKNKGNVSKSAKELGITRAALYRRLEKHGL